MKRLLAGLLLFCVALPSVAEPPSRPFATFAKAKVVARDGIYANHETDFYCGCAFEPKGASGGAIQAGECGYKPRKNKARGKQLEWEHVMPAYFFGHNRTCWRSGNAQCERNGTPYKGRACCAKVDNTFRKIEADLHNLVPAVGELNADRSNKPYGVVAGEPREYGACDFEVGGKPAVTEPPDNVRGDAARVWLYMSETHKIKLSDAERKMFEAWSRADPPDRWERLRDKRIAAAQGNHNEFVK